MQHPGQAERLALLIDCRREGAGIPEPYGPVALWQDRLTDNVLDNVSGKEETDF